MKISFMDTQYFALLLAYTWRCNGIHISVYNSKLYLQSTNLSTMMFPPIVPMFTLLFPRFPYSHQVTYPEDGPGPAMLTHHR